MRFSKNILTNSLKGVKITTLAGICALLGTQLLVSGQLNAETLTPTSYNISNLSLAMKRAIPTGYIKGNYKVIWNSEIDPKQINPSAKDLSMQDAAEIVAQEIFRFSNQNISNATFKMLYNPLTAKASSNWNAEVQVTPTCKFHVNINGSTGEFRSIVKKVHDSSNLLSSNSDKQTLDSLNSIQAAGEKNKKTYCEKAKKLIEQSGYLAESIQSIKYVSGNMHDDCDYDSKNNAKLYRMISYEFEVTTASNKIYKIELSKDLSQIMSVADKIIYDEM